MPTEILFANPIIVFH